MLTRLAARRMQGKLLQLALPQEVSPDRATAQRSATTGRLVITMPIEGACSEAPWCALRRSGKRSAGILALPDNHANASCCVGPAARPASNAQHATQGSFRLLRDRFLPQWRGCWLIKGNSSVGLAGAAQVGWYGSSGDWHWQACSTSEAATARHRAARQEPQSRRLCRGRDVVQASPCACGWRVQQRP